MAYGLFDQVLSSATNITLTILAGRWLGAAGLGTVAIGWATVMVYVVLQRAVVTDPLVVGTAALDDQGRHEAARRALSMVLIGTIAFGVSMLVAGRVIGGGFGRGIALFGPWVPSLGIQDFWRYMLFRDERGMAAVANDGAWAIAMALAAAALWRTVSAGAVVALWGIGATTGALLGFVQARVGPGNIVSSAQRWRRDTWPLARWFALDRASSSAGARGLLLLVGLILGTRDLGGLRAVQALFAPLTLLVPALSLPALPAVSRAVATSLRSAKRAAFWVSVLGILLVSVYFGGIGVVGRGWSHLLTVIFGPAFRGFGGLVAPVMAGQIVAAAGIGAEILLKASRRGRLLAFGRGIGAAVGLAAVALFTAPFGLLGAAWSASVGVGVGTGIVAVGAVRTRSTTEADVPTVAPPEPLAG